MPTWAGFFVTGLQLGRLGAGASTGAISVSRVRVAVRSFHFFDGHQALPPDIEVLPVAIGVLIARASRLAHFNAINGMDLPLRRSLRTASRAAGARAVGCVEEELSGDPIDMSLEARSHGRIGRVLLRLRVVGFKVPDLIP